MIDLFTFALRNARWEFSQPERSVMSTIEAKALISLALKYPGLVRDEVLKQAQLILRLAA